MDEKGNLPSETSQDVKQAADELVEKHRGTRSDKGKPRGPRKQTAAKEATVSPTPVDPALLINLEIVKDATKALLGAVDSMVCRRIYTKSTRLGADKALALEYAQSAGITKDEARVMADCSAAIMARSDFLIRHAPEVMLSCVAIAYTVRVVGTLKRLDELEEKMKKAHRINTPAKPAADEPSAQ